MRDLILVTFVFLMLPICVYRPWIGVLVWSWLGYMNPHRLSWGFAFDFPFAQIVAVATIAGLAWQFFAKRAMHGFLDGAELKLLLVLWLIFTGTTFFAMQPEDAWTQWEQLSKIILMAFLTAYLIDDEKKLRYLLLTIAFSFGFFGLKGGIFSILSGGQYRIWGPLGSFIADNNALALALNMALPFMFYLGRTEERKWLRNLLYLTFGLSIVSIIFTYSRGGFIGLIVVLFSIFLTMRMRWKILIVAVGLLALPVIESQLPDSWTSRMTSIKSYEQDGSALSRLHAWKAAWNLAMDKPLTGGGFQALNYREIFIRYNPEILDRMQEQGELGLHISGVHSIYFELIAENGFPGLLVFLALNFYLLLSLRSMSAKSSDPHRTAYGLMLSASLLAYLATGTFLELVSFDFFYQIVALVVVVKRIYVLPKSRPDMAT